MSHKGLLHSQDSHPISFLDFLLLFPPTFYFSWPSLPPLTSPWFMGRWSCSSAGKLNSLLPKVSSRWKRVCKVNIRLRCAPNPPPLSRCSNSHLAGSAHPSWIFPCEPSSAWERHQRNSPKPERTLELSGGKFPAQTPSPG